MQNSQNRLINLAWIVEIFLKDSLAVEKKNCDLVSTFLPNFYAMYFFIPSVSRSKEEMSCIILADQNVKKDPKYHVLLSGK